MGTWAHEMRVAYLTVCRKIAGKLPTLRIDSRGGGLQDRVAEIEDLNPVEKFTLPECPSVDFLELFKELFP